MRCSFGGVQKADESSELNIKCALAVLGAAAIRSEQKSTVSQPRCIESDSTVARPSEIPICLSLIHI